MKLNELMEMEDVCVFVSHLYQDRANKEFAVVTFKYKSCGFRSFEKMGKTKSTDGFIRVDKGPSEVLDSRHLAPTATKAVRNLHERIKKEFETINAQFDFMKLHMRLMRHDRFMLNYQNNQNNQNNEEEST